MAWNCDACGCCCCEYGDISWGIPDNYGPGCSVAGDVFNMTATYEDADSCEYKCVVNSGEQGEGEVLYQSCNDGTSNYDTSWNIGDDCTPCIPQFAEEEPFDLIGCWTDFEMTIPCPYDNGCSPATIQVNEDEGMCCGGVNSNLQGAYAFAGFRVVGGDVTAKLSITGTVERHSAGYDCASATIFKCDYTWNPDIQIICQEDYDALSAGLCSRNFNSPCGCDMETVSNCLTIRGNCDEGTLSKGTYVITAAFDTVDGEWHKGLTHTITLTQTGGSGSLEACPSWGGLKVQGLKAYYDKTKLIEQAVKKARYEAFFHRDLLTKLDRKKPRIHPFDAELKALADKMYGSPPSKKQLAKKALLEKMGKKLNEKGCGCGGKKSAKTAAPINERPRGSIKML
jgi:hypothetical protein